MFSSQFDPSSQVQLQPISPLQVTRFQEGVRQSLARSLSIGDIQLLGRAKPVQDDTTKLLVKDPNGKRIAVASCSPPTAPKIAARAEATSRMAKKILGPNLGLPILSCLCSGEIEGLSYFAVSYCAPLSRGRLTWYAQRMLLRRGLFRWWLHVAQRTSIRATSDEIYHNFELPLTHLAQMEGVTERVRLGALATLKRLAAGAWAPYHTLMHGDLWKGNVLIAPRYLAGFENRSWQERFVIIDWAGSIGKGYGIFDLIRLAASMKLSQKGLRQNVVAHCQALNCDVTDARSHLVSALAFMSMNLGHFPLYRFADVADSALVTLEKLGL